MRALLMPCAMRARVSRRRGLRRSIGLSSRRRRIMLSTTDGSTTVPPARLAAAVTAIYSWQHVGTSADLGRSHDRAKTAQGSRAADNQVVLLYANAVGGQDGLIYDGGGFIFQNGRQRDMRRQGMAAAA